MRTIAVVTVARSDYGIYLPILRQIQAEADLRLLLFVSGMHLSPEFGLTVTQIEEDGFEINERIETLLSSDTPEGIAKSIGLAIIGFAQVYARVQPDILLVLGDRFEMHAAALAALPFKIPIAHIHGGEVTQGAIDDALRHSMTKLSHLHFVSTQEYARRVAQLGEEDWRIVISGAPSLDNLRQVKLLSKREVETKFGICLVDAPLLVTYHPVTLEYEQTEFQIRELLAALDASQMPILFTMPNADTSGRIIIRMIKEFVQSHDSAQIVDNLGIQGYFSMMSLAAAMVGNSSSGIIEAASFKLPVVNIGTRQQGRVRGKNVIDVGYEREAILEGIERAIKAVFREKKLCNLKNPYGDGHAAKRITNALQTIPLEPKLIIKRFNNIFFDTSSQGID